MYFTKVELHNFGIYQGTHVMCLSDKRGDRNITLVGGLNGRGKTTFHNAIVLALYGRTAMKYIQERARSYEKLLSDHINKHATDDETYVSVTLCLDDGTEFRVKRSWYAKVKKIEEHIVVEKDGTADKYLGENWQYYVEQILPFGIAKFFFFDNEKIAMIADDNSFEQIKSSIKSAIGVSTIERTIEHVDDVIKRKKTALAAFENSEEFVEYQTVVDEIEDIDTKLQKATVAANDLECQCEKLAAELEIKEKEFWESGGELSRNREAIKEEMRKISDEVQKIRAEILQVAVDASTPLYMCRNLVSESYEEQLSSQKDEAKRYSDTLIDEMYHMIMQRLTESDLDHHAVDIAQTIINDVLFGQRNQENPRHVVPSMSATSMMLYQCLTTEIFQTIEQRIENLTNHIDMNESQLLSLEVHLGASDEKSIAMQLYDTLKTTEQEKTLAEEEFRRQKDLIDSLNRQRESLVTKRTQLIKTIAEKENANDDNARVIKYAAMSMEVLSEFKIRLQKEKVERLSETSTKCFAELVEKNSLVKQIFIDPETLDLTILDREGKELLKSQLSAGEQQMFAVSIVWALALTSGYKAPVVIDTPMGRLDSSHRANFVTKYLPAASSQVVVLSTDEEIYGRYLDLVRDNVVDYYTLLYREDEQCTSIVQGYFGEE